jgi:hypothetical protein
LLFLIYISLSNLKSLQYNFALATYQGWKGDGAFTLDDFQAMVFPVRPGGGEGMV